MELIDLSVERFRNLRIGGLDPGRSVNLVLGGNGVGKTSLLEAIVVLGNLRSFRTPSARRLVCHGETSFRITGSVMSGGRRHRLEQVVESGPPLQRSLRLDGAAADLGRYLSVFPVFAVSGPDRDLVVGGPEHRRALIDRFAFLLAEPHLNALRTYRRALRQRNAALSDHADQAEIEVWDRPLAAAAAKVVTTRAAAAAKLASNFTAIHAQLAGEDSEPVKLDYRGDPWCDPGEGLEKVEESYVRRYNETRKRDLQAGFTADGPHRHDLSLKTEGRSVRHVLSAGQAKVMAAALRLATHAEIERVRGERLPVIVDDVDAELDEAALARLVSLLGHERQLFLSSTTARVGGPAYPGTRKFWLEHGACVRQEAETDD